MNKRILLHLMVVVLFVAPAQAWYPRLQQEMRITQATTVVGHNRDYIAGSGETLMELARRTGIGFDNLLRANPGVDPWNPQPSGQLVLPSAVILPGALQTGITINLAELRLYLIWEDAGVRKVRIYPVGIGREGWGTPLGSFHVKVVIDDPDWTPPASLREEDAALPGIVRPGPDNPLGRYWIGLSVKGVGIHGSNQPLGVGRRVSHGCLRLYPEDIADLANRVGPGTRVRIIDQPVKHLVSEGRLYLEVYRSFKGIAELRISVDNWNREAIEQTLLDARGLPVEIERRDNISMVD